MDLGRVCDIIRLCNGCAVNWSTCRHRPRCRLRHTSVSEITGEGNVEMVGRVEKLQDAHIFYAHNRLRFKYATCQYVLFHGGFFFYFFFRPDSQETVCRARVAVSLCFFLSRHFALARLLRRLRLLKQHTLSLSLPTETYRSRFRSRTA